MKWVIAQAELVLRFPNSHGQRIPAGFSPLMNRSVASGSREHSSNYGITSTRHWDPLWDSLFCAPACCCGFFAGGRSAYVVRGVPCDSRAVISSSRLLARFPPRRTKPASSPGTHSGRRLACCTHDARWTGVQMTTSGEVNARAENSPASVVGRSRAYGLVTAVSSASATSKRKISRDLAVGIRFSLLACGDSRRPSLTCEKR